MTRIAGKLFPNERTLGDLINASRRYLEERGWTRGCLSEERWQRDPASTMHPPEEFMPSYLHYDIFCALEAETEERQKPKQLSLF